MLIPFSGIVASAIIVEPATHIEVYNGTEWVIYELADTTKPLPQGMTWNASKERLELNGYKGGSFRQRNIPETRNSISIYVEGSNVVNGYIKFFGGIKIAGSKNASLTVNTKDFFASITGIRELTDIELNVKTDIDAASGLHDDQPVMGVNTAIEPGSEGCKLVLKGKARLNIDVKSKRGIEEVDAIGVASDLELNDDSSVYINVFGDEKIRSVYGVLGKLTLKGTGDCIIKTSSDNTSSFTEACAVHPKAGEPVVTNPSIYKVFGKWDEKEVKYLNAAKARCEKNKWTKGEKEGLTFTSYYDFSQFENVKVDGKELSKDDYIEKEGSTIIYLKPSYLETLTVGTHDLEINFDAQVAMFTSKAQFEVLAKEEIAPTDDPTNLIEQVALLIGLGGFAAVAGVVRRKEDK
ncbi:MAG: hypothetical protein GX241_06945 [Ruminococcaceae bacterium]|nr:hypothetical protein [Oscillospiraceae bacterium]